MLLTVLFAFDMGGIRKRTIGPARIQSLAALPLESVSCDPEQACFADGMTKELSTRLAKVSALRVIAHGSVVAAAIGGTSAKDIGRALKVDPACDGLRSDPRFDAALGRIRLAP